MLSGGGRGRRTRCGGGADDRLPYLRELLDELKNTTSYDAKCQVLANLSNFAYDPSNYEYLRQIGALRVFIDHLQNEDLTLTHFACSGICNLCLDPVNAKYIIEHNGVELLISLLSADNEEIQLNAITSLMYLSEYDESIPKLSNVIQRMKDFQKSTNTRFVNLATIFLQDLCESETQIE